ncbi:unnamed protein product [Closterium sp. NIES-53]
MKPVRLQSTMLILMSRNTFPPSLLLTSHFRRQDSSTTPCESKRSCWRTCAQYLLHAEYKAQRGDPAGGLELISHALNLISGRFEVLQVEDASDFRTAKRFKLYQQPADLSTLQAGSRGHGGDGPGDKRIRSCQPRRKQRADAILTQAGPPAHGQLPCSCFGAAGARGFRCGQPLGFGARASVVASRATWQVPALGTGMAAKDPLRWCRSGPWH